MYHFISIEDNKLTHMNMCKWTSSRINLLMCTYTLKCVFPVGWGCRIHQLNLCREVRPQPTSVLVMTLNNLMMSF